MAEDGLIAGHDSSIHYSTTHKKDSKRRLLSNIAAMMIVMRIASQTGNYLVSYPDVLCINISTRTSDEPIAAALR
jgi:hypothetical protein